MKENDNGKAKPPSNGSLTLTPQARAIWESIPGNMHIRLLNNVWCVSCRKTTGIGGDVTGKVSRGMLVLHGRCTSCGGPVARVIETQ